MKVASQGAYLYRAIDKNGETIDFMLSPRRTAKSARRFLGKTLKLRQDCRPRRSTRGLRQSDTGAQAGWRVGQERSTPAGQISQQPARGRSRRAEAADQSDARVQDAAHSIGDDQRLRGHAHDPQAAMPHARIRNDGRSALCEPVIPLRRLIRRLGRGELRVSLAQCNRAPYGASGEAGAFQPVKDRHG